jgi:hypothetical protein
MNYKRIFITLVTLLASVALLFGAIKLYYMTTDGFSLGQITSTIIPKSEWDTHPLSLAEHNQINKVLDQEFVYLGKGCQSYVFASRDGKYVIKFFKHQHFRPQKWINNFTFIPAIERYQQNSKEVKGKKLDKLFIGCKIAYEELMEETGIIYVHLNKSVDWPKKLTIIDKMGMKHQLDLGQMEFILQHRASMLSDAINRLMTQSSYEEAKLLIDRLLAMIISEYQRGIADNDHALMQNTGVLNNRPIHIDIGQFIQNDIVKDADMYKKELFDKTFLFNKWLGLHHPELHNHLNNRLLALIGPDYFYFAPYKHKGNVAKIPHITPKP